MASMGNVPKISGRVTRRLRSTKRRELRATQRAQRRLPAGLGKIGTPLG